MDYNENLNRLREIANVAKSSLQEFEKMKPEILKQVESHNPEVAQKLREIAKYKDPSDIMKGAKRIMKQYQHHKK